MNLQRKTKSSMESLTRAVTAENFPAAILAQQKQPAANWGRALGLGMCALVWFYVSLLLVAWLLLATGGDRWWFSTLILFGPRWLCVLPLVLLVPMAAIWRRGLLWPLALAAILAVGPIMGLCLPWARLGVPKGPALRVLTCNLKGHCHDNPALNELIRTAAPDIVALQGCWSDVRVAWPAGWQVCQEGETLIASRYRLSPLQGLSQDATEESGNAARPDRAHGCTCWSARSRRLSASFASAPFIPKARTMSSTACSVARPCSGRRQALTWRRRSPSDGKTPRICANAFGSRANLKSSPAT